MSTTVSHKININAEMQQSYLDYAMSVIVSRALPDARDGLKPVQRRILYAMHDMGMRSDSTYKKSAAKIREKGLRFARSFAGALAFAHQKVLQGSKLP